MASKFFPVDDPSGKPYPLCETDYFRRLGLLCSKCGAALRGSYITALGEHSLPQLYSSLLIDETLRDSPQI